MQNVEMQSSVEDRRVGGPKQRIRRECAPIVCQQQLRDLGMCKWSALNGPVASGQVQRRPFQMHMVQAFCRPRRTRRPRIRLLRRCQFRLEGIIVGDILTQRTSLLHLGRSCRLKCRERGPRRPVLSVITIVNVNVLAPMGQLHPLVHYQSQL